MKRKLAAAVLSVLLLSTCLSTTAMAAGIWQQDATGIRYQMEDGSFLKDAWIQQGTNIYRFDANGYMKTGWVQVGNLWYYMNEAGICTNPNGTSQPPAEAVPAQQAATGGIAAGTGNDADSYNYYSQLSNSLQQKIYSGEIVYGTAQYWQALADIRYAQKNMALLHALTERDILDSYTVAQYRPNVSNPNDSSAHLDLDGIN